MSINRLENWNKLDQLEDDKQFVYARLYRLLHRADELEIHKALGLPDRLGNRTLSEVANFRAAVATLLQHHLDTDVTQDEAEKRALIQGILENIAEVSRITADIKKIESNPNAAYPEISVGRRAA